MCRKAHIIAAGNIIGQSPLHLPKANIILMMYLLRKNDVIRYAHNEVARELQSNSLLAMKRCLPNVPQGTHHCRRQHHWTKSTSFARARGSPKRACELWGFAVANIISKRHLPTASAFLISSTYKPGSVVNGHQSSPYVTAELQSERFVPPPRCAGQALVGVLLRIGFTADLCYHRNW